MSGITIYITFSDEQYFRITNIEAHNTNTSLVLGAGHVISSKRIILFYFIAVDLIAKRLAYEA